MRVSFFVIDAACDSSQFVWNCIFLFVQITCNACLACDVPIESELPLPVDLDFFFIHLLVIVSILQYDDRCPDIAGAYLLEPYFRFALTLVVCVNNMIFFFLI